MILRSTAQKRRSQILAASFAQLNLPWLAPAQLRWLSSHASPPLVSSPRNRRKFPDRTIPHNESLRKLATAADVYNSNSSGYDASSSLPTGKKLDEWDWRTAGLRERSSTISFDYATQSAVKPVRVMSGVSGNAMDLLQHLHTNIRIGRMARAKAIVLRLATSSLASAPELVYAHNAYLEELLRLALLNPAGSKPAQTAATEMGTWFKKEVEAKDVALDAQTLVIMTRATLHGLKHPSVDSVSYYTKLAHQMGGDVYEEVLYSDEYTDEEFEIVTKAADETPLDLDPHIPFETEPELSSEDQQLAQQKLSQHPVTVPPESYPEILATSQSGGGLSAVKKVVEAITEQTALPLDAPLDEQMARAMERQSKVEHTSADVALDAWRKADGELKTGGVHSVMQTKPVAALMWQWYATLLPVLEQELEECKKVLAREGSHRDEHRMFYGPYLELLPLKNIAASTILTTFMMMTKGKGRNRCEYTMDVKLSNITESLGRAIEAEVDAQNSATATKDWKSKRARALARYRRIRQAKLADDKEEIERSLAWPFNVKLKLGSMLVSKLIETAQLPVTREHPRTKQEITQMQPAFMHRVKYVRGKRVGLLTVNSALVSKLQSEPVASLLAKRMPMLVEPKPWTGWKEGGYYHYRNTILRQTFSEKSTKEYFQAADRQGDLDQVYAGLNALSKVPWRVNKDVFKVQLEAWNTGEGIASLAPLHPVMEMPAEPEPSADPNVRRQWFQEMKDLRNIKAGFHSQRCFQNFQLEVARAMINDTMYLPHNLDFRGRAYPIPPYLNHMGADNSRALMMFDKGKELEEEGLRWLKIHVANVAGYDKASLQEREDFTMQHMDDIRDSVKDPLGGRRWWLTAEDSWQTLAACFELVKALDSPDPTKYVSHLPIHQDGTCNGLQHYAALGGDTAGAAHVNLEPGDRPSDIYTAVAVAVAEEVARDAAAGNPDAMFLNGRITRKVVKQPVMTNVYGVTYYGAKEQVRKQLKDLFPNMSKSANINHSTMAGYVATKIFKSLGTMFTGAQAIQNWLTQCADIITSSLSPEQVTQLTYVPKSEDMSSQTKKRKTKKEVDELKVDYTSAPTRTDESLRKFIKPLFKSTVVWTTPLRLPVVQPYRKPKGKPIQTQMQQITIQEPQVWDPVSRHKQIQAFPPNFIHSLDATHMLLSAIKCNELGITFASIHDSFWTHASDITKMSSVLRDAFVVMHSDDIIGRLCEEFQTRYRGCMTMTSVLYGTGTTEKIVAWRRENRKKLTTPYSELAIEAERFRLMNSGLVEDLERGQAMVTPASLFEADGARPANVGDNAQQQLGLIPKDGEAAQETSADDVETVVKERLVTKRYLSIWTPIRFPELPKKGDFDVTRLRQSKYFFH